MRTILIALAVLALCACVNTTSYGPLTPLGLGSRASVLYVAAGQIPGSIASTSATANGTVTPTTFIFGPNATIGYDFFAFADSFNRIWTTSCIAVGFSGPTAFSTTATGNVAPLINVSGPINTGLSGCQGGVYVDAGGQVYVADGSSFAYPGGQVVVFASGANGDVTPIRRIAGTNANFHQPTGIWLDATGNLYVADSAIGFITVPPDVQVFAAGATGNVAATRVITGPNTNLNTPEGVLLDSSGNLYVANAGNNSIAIYAPGATGNVAPIRTIAGSNTLLDAPGGIAMDPAGYLYVGSINGSRNAPVLVFAPGASGNVAPVQQITINAPKSNYAAPAGIAVK